MAQSRGSSDDQLACTECKQRTYTTRKNKKNDPNRIELMKPARASTAYFLPRGEVGRDLAATEV